MGMLSDKERKIANILSEDEVKAAPSGLRKRLFRYIYPVWKAISPLFARAAEGLS